MRDFATVTGVALAAGLLFGAVLGAQPLVVDFAWALMHR